MSPSPNCSTCYRCRSSSSNFRYRWSLDGTASETRKMSEQTSRESRRKLDPDMIILTVVRASAAGVCASRRVVAVSLAVGSGSVGHGE
jgi:hypothetical protein